MSKRNDYWFQFSWFGFIPSHPLGLVIYGLQIVGVIATLASANWLETHGYSQYSGAVDLLFAGWIVVFAVLIFAKTDYRRRQA